VLVLVLVVGGQLLVAATAYCAAAAFSSVGQALKQGARRYRTVPESESGVRFPVPNGVVWVLYVVWLLFMVCAMWHAHWH
jgi:hypothetical protein